MLVGNLAGKVAVPLAGRGDPCKSRVHGSCASCGEYPACLELMARGTINVNPLTAATAAFEPWGRNGSSRLQASEDGLMKVILEP